jgi:hypothetical protein
MVAVALLIAFPLREVIAAGRNTGPRSLDQAKGGAQGRGTVQER